MSKRHGLSHHPIYATWRGMRKRCNESWRGDYRYYGARGIKVCEEWENDAAAFIRWGEAAGWAPGLTIDRIDPNGNYEPANCRWLTMQEQQRNRRNTGPNRAPPPVRAAFSGPRPLKPIIVDGVEISSTEAGRRFGIEPSTLRYRLKQGLTLEDAISRPLQRRVRLVTTE